MNDCKQCKVDNGLIMTQCYGCSPEPGDSKKNTKNRDPKEEKVDYLAHLPNI
jgi:hypothetical protein